MRIPTRAQLNCVLGSSLENTIIDMEKEEDVYDFHSLSLRLNMMEAENKALKKKLK